MTHTISHTIYLKIAVITAFLLVFIHLSSSLFGEKDVTLYAEKTNADIYMSAQGIDYGSIGVAISTRIGIAFSNGESKSNIFYREITTVGDTLEDKKELRREMIRQNMLITGEYLNLSRTDIKSLLSSSPDRKATLEGFISQLEMRYTNSALSLGSLEKQKELLIAHLTELESGIETTKTSMETNFGLANAASTLEDVDTYFKLRSDYTATFTDIVFINQFIKQHSFLNNYNKGILDTLINNKQAIIDQTYVVIPDSGDQYLRPLDLIFDEAEIKAQKEAE